MADASGSRSRRKAHRSLAQLFSPLPWQFIIITLAVLTTAGGWWATFDRLFLGRLVFDWAAIILMLSMLRERRRILGGTPIGWAAAVVVLGLWFLGERIADYSSYIHTGHPNLHFGAIDARLSAVLFICAVLAVRDEWRYRTALRVINETK